MNNRFTADGPDHLRRSPELRARLAALRAEVEARHAPRLAAAGWFGRWVVRWSREREWRRARRALLPSLETLYAGR